MATIQELYTAISEAPADTSSDDPVSAFLNTPDSDPAQERDALARRAAQSLLGIDSPDGSAFHPQRQPLPTGQYAATMSKILSEGLSSLDDEETASYRRLVSPLDQGPVPQEESDRIRAERLRLARKWKGPFKNAARAISGALVTSSDDEIQTLEEQEAQIAERRTKDEDADIADYENELYARNWLLNYKAMQPDLTPQADAIVAAAVKSGTGIPEEHVAAFQALPEDQAEKVAFLARSAMPEASRNWLRDTAVGVRDLSERMRLNLADFGASAGEAFGEMGARAQGLKSEAIDPALRREIDRRELLLRDTNAHKPYSKYGTWLEKPLMEAAATLPYMAVAAVPGVGTAAVAVDQFQSVRDRVIREGGDPDQALLAQAAAATAYAYVEKLSFGSAFGKPMTTLGRRQLFLNLSRGGFALAARQAGAEWATGTAAETLEEQVQQSIEEAVVGHVTDDPETARKIVQGFIEQASSIRTMAAVSFFGTGSKSYHAYKTRKTKESAADFAARQLKVQGILSKNVQTSETDTSADPTPRVEATLAEARRAWFTPPSLSAGLKALTDLGYTQSQAITLAEYLDEEKLAYGNKASRPRYVAETTLDVQAALTAAIPGAVVEPITPAVTDTTPQTDVQTSEIQKPDPEPSATITRKVNRGGRRVTLTQPNPAHAEWQARQSESPAPVQRSKAPAKQAPSWRVTLPSGGTYIVDTAPYQVDTSTPEFAASVQQATGGAVRAQDFLAMSDEARAQVAASNGLSERGNFTILSPDGRRLADAQGLIRLVTPQTAAAGQAPASDLTLLHEHAHAAFALAREAGALTPEHAAILADIFGPAVNPGELFNEEAASDAFAEYAAGLAEDTPASGPFAAVKAFIERLLRALRLLPDPAEKDRQTKAREAAFEAIRSGDFAGLSPYAGITVTPAKQSDSAASATPDTQPAPAPSAPPQDSEAAALAAVDAAASEAKTPDAKPKAPRSNQALEAKIDALQAKLDAVLSGQAYAAPQRARQQPAADGTAPAPVTVHTPTGGLTFDTEWMWVDRSDLVDSSNPAYPQKYQPRDRDRVASLAQIHNLSRPGTFTHERLLDSVESDGGSPIVAGGNVILSGNGRKAVLDKVAAEGRYQAEYAEPVKRWAEGRGIPPPPAGMSEPVLVRRITSVPETDGDTLKKIAELSNRAKILQRSEAELAEADARLLTPSMLRLYSPGAGGNLLASSNAPFMQAFIKAAGAEGDVDNKGRPTAALAVRVQQAMLAAVIGTDEQARVLIRTLIEREPRLALGTLYNDLIDQAGQIIDLGITLPTLSITDSLRDAVRRYIGWRSADPLPALDDLLSQDDMFTGKVPPETAALMRLAAAQRLGKVLDRYAALARLQGANTGSLNIVADRSPLQLLAIAERDRLEEGETAVTPEPATLPAPEPAPAPAPETVPAPVQAHVQTPQAQRSETPAQPAPAPAPTPAPSAPFVPTPHSPTTLDTPEGTPVWNALGTGSKEVPTTDAPTSKWKEIVPNFQGGKYELTDRATAAIQRLMTPEERARVTRVDDYFGGGGAWGLFNALESFPNADRVVIGEYNPGRREKIRVFLEKGDQLGELIKRTLPLVNTVVAELDKIEKTSGTALGDRLEKMLNADNMTLLKQLQRDDPDALGALYAIIDNRTSNRSSGVDEQGNKSGQAKYEKMRDAVIKEAADAYRGAEAFRARIPGATIEILPAGDAYEREPAAGSRVFSVIDPPYYRTKGYNGVTTVGLDFYQKNRDLIRRVAEAGNGILYTDEAWWNKPDFVPMQAETLFGEKHSTEQQILLDILNTIDHFDVVDGKVGKRTEVMGVNHVHATAADDAAAGGQGNSDSGDVSGRPAQRPDAPGGAHADLQDQALLGMAAGDAGGPAPVRSGDDRLAPRHSVTASPAPDLDALGFYSPLRRHLAAKMPSRATVSAVRGLIDPSKGSGVKLDEIQWSGLADFLDAHEPSDMVTKDDVLAAIRDVPLKETVLSKPSTDDDILRPHIERVASDAAEWKAIWPRYPFTDLNEEERREFAWANRLDVANHVQRTNNDTRYDQYTLPGYKPGTYREILVQLTPPKLSKNGFEIIPDPEHDGYKAIRNPQGAIIETWMSDPEARERLATYGEVTSADTYKSSHFQAHPNILTHARTDERDLPDGTPVLFIEEIQSDWHQQGREKGYNDRTTSGGFGIWINNGPEAGQFLDNPDAGSRWEFASEAEAQEVADEMGDPGEYEPRQIGPQKITGVPDAPYKDTSKGWARLMFRRLLRRAAEAGLPAVAWTDGDTQADRYDLSRQATLITVHKNSPDEYELEVFTAYDGDRPEFVETTTASKLPDLVGKDLARRISQDFDGADLSDTRQNPRHYSGNDLKVGGAGMREFYDRILPRIADDLGKKYGAKATTATVADPEKTMTARDLGGIGSDGQRYWVKTAAGEQTGPTFPSYIAADDYRTSMIKGETTNVHVLRIPPAMAADILAGQPRHSVTAAHKVPKTLADWKRFWDNPSPMKPEEESAVKKAEMDDEDVFQHYFDVIVPRQKSRPITPDTRWGKGIIAQDDAIGLVPQHKTQFAVSTQRETIGPWDHSILWPEVEDTGIEHYNRFTLWDGDVVWIEAPSRGQFEAVNAMLKDIRPRPHHRHYLGGEIDFRGVWHRPQGVRHHVTASRKDPGAWAQAWLAHRAITGKKPTLADAQDILRTVGAKDDPQQILDAALAQYTRSEGDVVAQARLSDRDLLAKLTEEADRQRYEQRVARTFAKGALYGADGSDQIMRIERARDKALRRDIETAAGYTAAEMQTELGVDLSQAVLNTPDVQPTAQEIEARQLERDRRRIAEEAAADDTPEAHAPVPPSPQMQALLDEILGAARARADADALEAQRKALAKRQADGTDDNATDEAAPAGDQPELADLKPQTVYALVAPAITNPEEFASFVYEWATRRIRADRPELDPATLYRHPAALRDLQRTAQHILGQLARDLLGTGQARIQAERDIAAIADGKTPRRVLLDLAYIYSRIHASALRESREDMIDALERDIKRLAVEPGRFLSGREDLKRRVTAAVETFSRTLISYMRLNPSQLQAEYDRLAKIVQEADAEETATGYKADQDARFKKAIDQLAVLKEFGGMINWMPGQIAEASDRIREQLSGQRAEHEARKADAEAKAAGIAKALTAAVIHQDEARLQPEPNQLSRWADSMIGNLQLRLHHAIRFASGKKREAALKAIEDIMVTLGDAATSYRMFQADAHAKLNKALKDIYGDARAALRRLDSPIPPEAQKALSRQGVALTYGNALQLYASIIQRDYLPNTRKHGRHKDLDTMRQILTPQDLALHRWLVGWYAENRAALSAAQEAITGLPVLSPDRLYMPVRMRLEPRGFRGRHAAWTPILASLTPRIRNNRDFDERASVLDMFSDRLEDSALITAYGPAGMFLRDAIGSEGFQSALERHHGAAARATLVNQIEDTLRGGRSIARADAYLAPVNTARRWIARFFLSGNVLSAVKQLASVPVWANVVGFRDFARYLTHIDPTAVRELMASPGFAARYGTGWSEETANLLTDQKRGAISKAYDKGLIINSAMDAVSGLWIAQGLYRDLKARYADQGYAPDEAKSRAQTVVWNLIEQTQQSARTENLTVLHREGGHAARLLLQFANSPLQQLQYEVEAIREFKAGTEGAGARLARALIINHVIVPGLLYAISAGFDALIGREPEDKDRWREIIAAAILGQASSLFLIGAMGERGLQAFIGMKPKFGSGSELPVQSAVGIAGDAMRTVRDAVLLLTPGDLSDVTTEDLLADIHRLAKRVNAPYRHISEAYRNRADR